MHFGLGKNMLVGDVFGAETATLITYYGFFIIAGVALFYWKVIEKKPLTAMGLSKETALILPKMEPLLFVFVCRPLHYMTSFASTTLNPQYQNFLFSNHNNICLLLQ